MPKNIKEQTWVEADMQRAVAAVKRHQMGYLAAAKAFNVPRTTLFRYCKKEGENVKKTKLGRKSILPDELENDLVNHLILMESKYFGLTRQDVRRAAYQLAKRNNLPNRFSILHQAAGSKWLRLFLKRHGDKISLRRPTGTSVARAVGFNKQDVDQFFNLLEQLMEEKHFPPSRIFNVDETGLCVVQSKCPEVIALKGKRQVGSLTSAERGSLVTVVLCMSASGTFVPPMIIFPRKNANEQLKKGAPPGTLFRYHPSGWIQMDLFTEWFTHFVEQTRPTEENPVLLILDGHHTHTRNLDVVLYAKQHFVTILCLPPHSTHKLQPLDKTVMGALKMFYNEEIRIFLRTNQRAVNHFDISELFGRAYLKIQSGERAIKGFAATGLYPTRRDVFKEEDFLAAEGQNMEEQMPGPGHQTPPHANPEPLGEQVGVGTNENDISTISVRPEAILPMPKLQRKEGTRGRKRGKAKIITSTPNKEELETSMNKAKSVKRNVFDGAGSSSAPECKKLTLTKKKPVKKQQQDSSSSASSASVPVQDSSDEEFFAGVVPERDAECIFCYVSFSADNHGEVWVKCLACHLWAHEACAGADGDYYVCDFCK